MAVEMCKLSLWLVSLDPKLPFSFVDDKILHGNSLLGLTDVAAAQAYQHIDPDAAHTQQTLFAIDVDGVLRAGRPAAAQPRQRGQQRRPAALSQHEAPPVAAVPARSRPSSPRSPTPSSPQASSSAASRAGRSTSRTRTSAIALGEAYPDSGLFANEPRPHQARRDPGRRALPPRSRRTTTAGSRSTGSSPSRTSWKGAASTPSSATRRSWVARSLPALWAPTSVIGSSMSSQTGRKGNADLVAYFFLRAMSLLNTDGQHWSDRDEHRCARRYARSRP